MQPEYVQATRELSKNARLQLISHACIHSPFLCILGYIVDADWRMNMDHGHLDIAGAAFWIFIAVVVAASSWEKARRNAEKHETLRRIIDKTGVVDEARLKELFAPPPSSEWWKSTPRPPGTGYRVLRILGMIVMGFGGALAILALLIRQFGPAHDQPGWSIALPMAFAIACLGLAIFMASRYASSPPDQKSERDR